MPPKLIVVTQQPREIDKKENGKSCSNLMLILFLARGALGKEGLNLVKCQTAGGGGIYNFTQSSLCLRTGTY